MSSAEEIISNLNSSPSSSTEDIEKKTKKIQKVLSDIKKFIPTHELKNSLPAAGSRSKGKRNI